MYLYPDIDDQNFLTKIKNDDWNDGGLEKIYLKKCFSMIPLNKKNNLLDAGCGTGSKLSFLSEFYQQIMAVEPDINRINKAKKQNQKNKNIEFVHSSIQNLDTSEQFDCIFCCQIIQHLNTNQIQPVFNMFKKLLKKNGYLILLTTNCLDDEDQFLKVNCETNAHIPLSKEEFNQCANTNDHYLPTRLITETTLRSLLDKFNYEIIFLKKFNGYPKIKGDNFVFAQAR